MDECKHICATCKYYRHVSWYVRSKCTNYHDMLGVVIMSDESVAVEDVDVYFVTTPDYGCILWEKRDE